MGTVTRGFPRPRCSLSGVTSTAASHLCPPQVFERLLNYLQPEERARISRFRRQRDALLAMAGRLMIRSYLVEKLKVPWDNVRLGRTPENKPFLVGIPDNDRIPRMTCSNGIHIAFNVSHHGDWTVLAAVEAPCSRSIGVDVMRIELSMIPGESTDVFLDCFRSQLTPREWSYVRAATVDRGRLERFYRLWCLKESYVKAVGQGLGIDLRTLEFVIQEPLDAQRPGQAVTSPLLFIPPLEKDYPTDDIGFRVPESYIFEEYFLDQNHCAAVCLACDAARGQLPPAPPTPARFERIETVNHLLRQAQSL
ncbi:MAG: 4'-phosphopantetheinyl transferase superfamily [Olpidium bornovanus]|uniref:holo-[acyl-carrier-protein] synthase n=1 Tax=Olpidium bornovanus TaxID=278681 RepID=A0A8H7ZPR5_9FUNG|nr:MAG: 4'-phosphopantetheinyl transferase superfamily [Olpidium bornovanus]